LGQLFINVGPGADHSIPSTESVFGPNQAPGIDVQSNYFLAGCSSQLEYRDLPGDPHKGLYAAVAYNRYAAETDDRFSFHRVSAAVEQYFPFLNRKRVIGLRAQTELNYHSGNQVVPFYLQPYLGSDVTLRGFRPYRFYDENALAMTAEYRWEIATGFDMAVFADAGKVFHRPGDISLSDMETSVGFGLRFKNRTTVFGRIDTGFSHEGVEVWVRFGRPFSQSY
jgi:outer membrane protein assembly factor BamA